MIKAIIFDCFGVLVTDALDGIVSELNIAKEEVEEIRKLVVAANRGQISPDIYRSAVASKLGITVDEYILKIRQSEVINRPLLEYIAGLKDRYKIGLLSNVSSVDSLKSRFTNNELDIFDLVIASAQIGYAKPEAQAYEITATRLGVLFTECVMVDDREDYCEGALGVGMKAVQYHTLDQMKTDLEYFLNKSY